MRTIALLLALIAGAWLMPQNASAQQASVSFQVFYDELGPYGTWVEYPNYGYVWIPDVDPGFSPYATSGHWVFTVDGWTWVSDYPWGWAAFHYGRWDYDNVYGWFWVPDNEWGPAWVSWRRSPGYYGWAPLRPGISVSIALGRDYRERDDRWVFARDRDISRSDISRRYVNRTRNAAIIKNSTVVVNTHKDDRRSATYLAGPDRVDVQRTTHTTVTAVTVRETGQPVHRVNNGVLQTFRPQVQKPAGAGQNPAPSRVARLNEVKPVSERNAANRPPTVAPTNPEQKSPPPQPQTPQRMQYIGRGQPTRTANPPKVGQPEQPGNVHPPNDRGKETQPQSVPPPKKADEPQPRPNQDGQDRRPGS